MDFWHHHQNFQKDSWKDQDFKIKKNCLLHAKHWWSPHEKRKDKNDPVSSLATKCYCPPTYRLKVEAISFAIM